MKTVWEPDQESSPRQVWSNWCSNAQRFLASPNTCSSNWTATRTNLTPCSSKEKLYLGRPISAWRTWPNKILRRSADGRPKSARHTAKVKKNTTSMLGNGATKEEHLQSFPSYTLPNSSLLYICCTPWQVTAWYGIVPFSFIYIPITCMLCTAFISIDHHV